MFENLCAVFTASPDGGEDRDLLAVSGVRAARRFEVRTVSGTEGPGGLTGLVLVELDTTLDLHESGLRSAVESLRSGSEGASLAYLGTGLGGHGEIELPAHLYLNFSAQPEFMTFDEYSDWYGEHQADNIANTATLTRGWRFGLASLDPGTNPGPTHLAAYQLEADLASMQADLDAAMSAGVISLPDWFRRFASLEALALDDRSVAAG